MIVEAILCCRFVRMCISDSIVCKYVPVNELPIGLCCFMNIIIIVGMLLAIPNVFYLVQVILQCFTRTCIFPLY